MKIQSSVCTNLFFPASRKSIDEFSRMAHYLSSQCGVMGIEFYHDGDGADQVGKVLADQKLSGVYIAVIPLKEKQLHLCNTDADGRKAALQLTKDCIDQAAANGMKTLMFNSGRIGELPAAGVLALKASVEALYEYIAQRGYSMQLCMEPCDSAMDAKQLIGPASRTKALVEQLHKDGFPLGITLDTAHVAEEHEDFFTGLTLLKPYCNHIHFANCIINDPASPLYGDKHVGYEYVGSEWGFDTLEKLTKKLETLYPDDQPLRIGLEVLCREADPYSYFENTWQKMSYLHTSGGVQK